MGLVLDAQFLYQAMGRIWSKINNGCQGRRILNTAARGGDPMVMAARGVDSQAWTSTAGPTGIMTGITTGIT